jgi:AcrR family transcriptional regulator
MDSPPPRVNRRLRPAPAAAAVSLKSAKPRDAARTRARILEAAQHVFSTRGYAHAGMRDIAADAHVNVALVARYFGSKEKLFEAALDALLSRGELWAVPRETFGRSIVAKFIGAAPAHPHPLPMLMQAAADPAAQSVALGLIQTRLIVPLGKWLGPPNGEARAGQILALCAGFFTYRIMLPLKPFSGSLNPAVRKWMEDALQDIADRGPPPRR